MSIEHQTITIVKCDGWRCKSKIKISSEIGFLPQKCLESELKSRNWQIWEPSFIEYPLLPQNKPPRDEYYLCPNCYDLKNDSHKIVRFDKLGGFIIKSG